MYNRGVKLSKRTVVGLLGAAILASAGWVSLETAHSSGTTGIQNLLKSVIPASSSGGLSSAEIGDGLKEALRVGSASVVGQLGQADGFNSDAAIHIPLPKSMKKVQSVLDQVGMSSLLDDLELRLNRAAEAATPKAKAIFWQAIREMTLTDVKEIYDGPEDAATRYFQRKMSLPLAEEMRPVVDDSLAQVGAVQAYEKTMGKYRAIPFVPDVKADLTSHVVEKGLDGIFYYLAREEAAIRQNPIKRTTELLQRVFDNH
jgi:hypothetical protein